MTKFPATATEIDPLSDHIFQSAANFYRQALTSNTVNHYRWSSSTETFELYAGDQYETNPTFQQISYEQFYEQLAAYLNNIQITNERGTQATRTTKTYEYHYGIPVNLHHHAHKTGPLTPISPQLP